MMGNTELLKATQHIRTLGRRTHTHLMLCAEDFLCVVKLKDKQHRRQLLAGFLASRLARFVGLPTPEPVVVEIPDYLMRTTPELAQANLPSTITSASLHPATYYAGNLYGKKLVDLLPDAYLASLDNLASFAHLLALDQWCAHRGVPRCVFYRTPGSPNYSVEFVNRSASFGGASLTFDDQPQNGVYDARVVYQQVRGWDSFEPFLTSLILTSPDTLWQLTRQLPFGWSEEFSLELEAIVEGLLHRRSLIRQLIARSRDQVPALFPNWTRRAFMPAQSNWLEAQRATGNREVFPVRNTSWTN